MKRRLKDFALLEYAAKHWGDHARELETMGKGSDHELERDEHESHTAIAMSFLLNEQLVLSAFQTMISKRQQDRSYFEILHTRALHLSSYFGIRGLSALLLPSEADVDASGCFWEEGIHTLSKGVTALHVACHRGYVEIAKLLLDRGANVNAQDHQLRTALHEASSRGDTCVARFILNTGDVQLNSGDECGRTPLSFASENGYEATAELLVETGKVDVDSKDKDGWTPLSLTTRNGHEAIAELLVETGRVDVDSKD